MAEMRKDFDEYTNYRYSTWLRRRISGNYRRNLLSSRINRARRKDLYEQFKEDMFFVDQLIVLLCCCVDLPSYRSSLARILRRFSSGSR
jgi:hypothetical protein